jgi:(2Fe-2S) ferredoxin
MNKLTPKDLESIKQTRGQADRNWIKVGYSTCGIAAGAKEVYDTLVEESRKHNADIDIKKCGCVGMCSAEPLVEVRVKGLPTVFYGKVDKEVAIKIMEKHVGGKMLVNDRIYDMKLN